MRKILIGTCVDHDYENYYLDCLEDGKEIEIRKSEAMERMMHGEEYVVLATNLKNDIYIATQKIDEELNAFDNDSTFKINDIVTGIVYAMTDLGWKVMLNKTHMGLLYRNETFSPIQVGGTYYFHISKIRDDKRIDITVKPVGYYKSSNENTKQIMNYLLKNGGRMELSDSSKPEDIKKALGISKKKFKEAIGKLYKQKKIKIEDKYVELVR